MEWLREHFFSYTIVTLLLFVTLISYARFMVLHDYTVEYETDCDPYTESCFIGCEDDECTEEYYYANIQKYAPNIKAGCGADITDCDLAYQCGSQDGDQCEIVYCDSAIDEEGVCEELTEADREEEVMEDDEDVAVEVEEDIAEDAETNLAEEESIIDEEL